MLGEGYRRRRRGGVTGCGLAAPGTPALELKLRRHQRPGKSQTDTPGVRYSRGLPRPPALPERPAPLTAQPGNATGASATTRATRDAATGPGRGGSAAPTQSEYGHRTLPERSGGWVLGEDYHRPRRGGVTTGSLPAPGTPATK